MDPLPIVSESTGKALNDISTILHQNSTPHDLMLVSLIITELFLPSSELTWHVHLLTIGEEGASTRALYSLPHFLNLLPFDFGRLKKW